MEFPKHELTVHNHSKWTFLKMQDVMAIGGGRSQVAGSHKPGITDGHYVM